MNYTSCSSPLASDAHCNGHTEFDRLQSTTFHHPSQYRPYSIVDRLFRLMLYRTVFYLSAGLLWCSGAGSKQHSHVQSVNSEFLQGVQQCRGQVGALPRAWSALQ